MLGILIGLLTSWLLLWLFERKNLAVLALDPSKNRVYNFIFGFLISIICCATYFFILAAIAKANLTLNKNFTGKILVDSFWWTLKSVLFEELLFRGALLYIAIERLGAKVACIISAVAFGIYHWFSYGIFGDPMQMLSVFIITGIWGLMFAYTFALTKSLYLPIGLHLGWNIITIIMFSQGSLGEQFLISSSGEKLSGFLSVLLFLYQILVLPLITYWYVKRQASKPLILTKESKH